jgi:diguanylate cyclase (GGDEF)-like protein
VTQFISQLRQLRHSDQAVAAHVRAVLVTSLYASPKSLVLGALTSSGIAFVVAGNAHDILLTLCALLIGLVGAIRIIGVFWTKPRSVGADERQIAVQKSDSPRTDSPQNEGTRRWEFYYRLGAFSYSALLGLFGFLTLTRTNNGVLELLSVTTAIGYAAGIAGRNAGRPWIALCQLCLASLPLVLGLLLTGELLKIVLAVVILLFVVAMMDITLQTYHVILDATVATDEKSALAEFHAAVARRDELTGLSNRTAFREQFELWLELLRETGGKMSIHWLDLDRFKEVNDLLGHVAGNMLLAGVANRLKDAFGEAGIVARLGGDEFVIVSSITESGDAVEIGNRVLDLVSQPVECDGHYLRVHASLGVAIAPADGTDADTLLKNADLALYRAKESGRGTMCFYESAMDKKIERSRQLAFELQDALERKEFRLEFQPIFDLASERVICCEALLRWDNRLHGEIAPDEFISIAEDSGLIVEIGGWVMREACLAARNWPCNVRVAVNLSPIQLRAPDLPAVILNALTESGLAAERLEFEVTESVLLDDIEASHIALNAINLMKVGITLDDFGTGYSSLSYLTKFPFQTLKIDRSFIADLDESPASMAIVQTVVDLAATLGMHTVAEGIETPTQLEQLRRTRCNAAQGYLLAKPMSASMVETMLADHSVRAA